MTGPADDLRARLAAVLGEVMTVQEESDGALTVAHDGTFASLRTVTIAEGLEMVSLTQVLSWDLPLDAKLRDAVAEHARRTLLGTVSLAVKDPAVAQKNAKRYADVLLRYNFPAAGLADGPLCTLIVMVLAGGADVRRALTA